jgi:hypothetical protein
VTSQNAFLIDLAGNGELRSSAIAQLGPILSAFKTSGA